MGISIGGGMIVGRMSWEIHIDFDEDEYYGNSDFLYQVHDMDILSPRYYADEDDLVIGFKMRWCMVYDIIDRKEWILELKEKADKFLEITGGRAKLIGMQDVY